MRNLEGTSANAMINGQYDDDRLLCHLDIEMTRDNVFAGLHDGNQRLNSVTIGSVEGESFTDRMSRGRTDRALRRLIINHATVAFTGTRRWASPITINEKETLHLANAAGVIYGVTTLNGGTIVLAQSIPATSMINFGGLISKESTLLNHTPHQTTFASTLLSEGILTIADVPEAEGIDLAGSVINFGAVTFTLGTDIVTMSQASLHFGSITLDPATIWTPPFAPIYRDRHY